MGATRDGEVLQVGEEHWQILYRNIYLEHDIHGVIQ
jgi:hypothetical protein